MRKIIYGVSGSLDGYIARLDGSLDFFLVAPFTADQRTSAIVQFPGGYIAEIHSIANKAN
jgi:hypothetical protein